MNKIENQFTSIQQVTDRYLNANSSSAAKGTSDVSFEEILKRKQDVSEAFELKYQSFQKAERTSGSRCSESK